MSDVTIEVVEDAEHPEGGHAVIRLNGLWLLPAHASFRIEPVEAADSDQLPQGWPRGDRTPLATRLTPQGVEIVVGPDIVDAPPLLPGTPVTVSVPAAFVRADVLWPDLPVSAPVAAPPVVLTAAELAAELDAVALANRLRDETAALQKMRAEMNGTGADDIAVVHDDGEARGLSELRQRSAAEPSVAAVAGDVALAAAAAPVPGHDMSMSKHRSAAQGALANSASVSVTTLAVDRSRSRDLVPVAPTPSARPPRGTMAKGLPFALGFAIAALLTGLFAWRQGGVSAPRGLDPAAPLASLADVLAVAVVSPRGRSAADVDLPTALKLADDSLHATVGGADHAEASFWLRKSLALSVGSRQLSWTLTQLGTLYAQPAAGAPDFGKARILWEMAGGSGDPIALCFLAALHEHGLGVPRDTRRALGLYQRAKAQGATDQGGCTDIDGSIARVRN